MRRVLIIVLIIVAIWAGLWFFYFKPKQATTGVSPVPNVLKPFFPVSTSTGGSFGSDTIPGVVGNTSNATTPGAPSPFTQLTGHPVAGYTIFDLTNKVSIPSTDPKKKPTVQTVTDHYIRYVSRQNGYVYEIKDSGTPLQITNIFIPNIYEAQFADSNTTALLRFLRNDSETIATYSVPIPSLNNDGTRTQKTGTFLPDNILELAVSPDQTQLARVTVDNSGSIVTTSTSLGTKIKAIAKSPFVEWLPFWVKNTVYLQTKAASIANGFLYKIDSSTARLSRALGDIPGLTVSMSPSGTYILYSQSTGTGFSTSIFNTKTNTTNNLSLSIMPENCAWLQNEDLICGGGNTVKNATYPDDWYAGVVHFSDQLYKISTKSNTYTVLYNNSGQSFDMTTLKVDENQHLLYFIDKNTGYLWQFSY
ncbi:MAG TPA: hypothetical protein VL576_03750 [Candidatus Paceibacterota bacterium]|jgi:hypothetical protein|nr:hypothetical protein [Candidatus Paceibacterota bacterium]